MQECETNFDNVPMSTFKILIMFRSVWRCSEMGYTMGCDKSLKGSKFTPIICVKCFNGGSEQVG